MREARRITSPEGVAGARGARGPQHCPSWATGASGKFGSSLAANGVGNPAVALWSCRVVCAGRDQRDPWGRALRRPERCSWLVRSSPGPRMTAAVKVLHWGLIAPQYTEGSSSSQLFRLKCSLGKHLALAVGVVLHPVLQSLVWLKQEWHMGKLLLSLVARVCAEHPSGGCLGETSYAAKGSKLEDFSPFALLPLPAGGLRAAARGLAVVATDPYLPPTPALG